MPRAEDAPIRRTRYFSKLAARNISSARMLKRGETLGHGGPDVWRNVSEHCLVQTAGVRFLAERLGLSSRPTSNLEHAAMLHDWDKKYQSTGLKAIDAQVDAGEVTDEERGRLKQELYEQSEVHNKLGMIRAGVPQEVITLAMADGHGSLPRMMDPNCTIEEKILHYVGSITNNDQIVRLDERIDRLESDPKYQAMNEHGRSYEWTNGRSFFEVQREVGHTIEAEIVLRIALSGRFIGVRNSTGVLISSEQWKDRLLAQPVGLPDFIKSGIESNY